MSQPIPAGYRLAVIDPDGSILETIELEGMRPAVPLAACDLGQQVATIVDHAEGD